MVLLPASSQQYQACSGQWGIPGWSPGSATVFWPVVCICKSCLRKVWLMEKMNRCRMFSYALKVSTWRSPFREPRVTTLWWSTTDRTTTLTSLERTAEIKFHRMSSRRPISFSLRSNQTARHKQQDSSLITQRKKADRTQSRVRRSKATNNLQIISLWINIPDSAR